MDELTRMNCQCESTVIEIMMGVERCAACGKLAGGDAFRTLGEPLPTKATKRPRAAATTPPRMAVGARVVVNAPHSTHNGKTGRVARYTAKNVIIDLDEAVPHRGMMIWQMTVPAAMLADMSEVPMTPLQAHIARVNAALAASRIAAEKA